MKFPGINYEFHNIIGLKHSDFDDLKWLLMDRMVGTSTAENTKILTQHMKRIS